MTVKIKARLPSNNNYVSTHNLLVQRQREENDLMFQPLELGQNLDQNQNSNSEHQLPQILVANQQKSTTIPAGQTKSI